ncbi:MAG: peptidoglycan -binding protein [Pseudomonadota bacterium]
MARIRAQRRSQMSADYWPGFVDALTTLLLVFIFLLSIFMLAQYFVSQESSGKDDTMRRLDQRIAELTNLLSLEKGKARGAEDQLAALSASLAQLQAENQRLTSAAGAGDRRAQAAQVQIGTLNTKLTEQQKLSTSALAKVDLLNQQLLAIRRQIAALKQALAASEAKEQKSQVRIADLGKRLNVALARKVQELQRYRSDFFGRLRELLAGRKDIRVVGDRFVFESEVLFPSGQAQMTPQGLSALDPVARAIIELAKQIPPEIDWKLQVDGHTDVRPIRSAQFPSNLELSIARATSVVRYLIAQGVPRERLVAAGHGAFSPLETGDTEDVYRRNRRIELKLTNR